MPVVDRRFDEAERAITGDVAQRHDWVALPVLTCLVKSRIALSQPPHAHTADRNLARCFIKALSSASKKVRGAALRSSHYVAATAGPGRAQVVLRVADESDS